MEAYESNWMSTVGKNIDELERLASNYIGTGYAVALSSGTAAMHLAIKLAGEQVYGRSQAGHGTLEGQKVFCSDMTFGATVNPIAYEGGEAVFIDAEKDTWNMDPQALIRAFETYPDVRIVILVHLYGVPGKINEIREICDLHHALLIEDAAESLGSLYHDKQTGSFGDYSIISFNGNKIITGTSGGMLLVNDVYSANKARKWSTQAREAAPWYQHEEIGYNYRMSNVIAGIVRGQWKHIGEHIDLKRKIYETYYKGLKDLPIKMNPYDSKNSVPNYWLSCLLIDEDSMCKSIRNDKNFLYKSVKGKSCPDEIMEKLRVFKIESRPIWKPMHMQPFYYNHMFITKSGSGRGRSNAYIASERVTDIGASIFERGLCLPSDIKMDNMEQKTIIEIIHRCFE